MEANELSAVFILYSLLFFLSDWERSRMLQRGGCCRCENDFCSFIYFFRVFFCIQRVNNLTTRHNLSFLCALALAMRASASTKHSKNEELIIRSKLFKWWWCNLLSRSLNMKFALITSWYESKILTLDIGLLKLFDPPHTLWWTCWFIGIRSNWLGICRWFKKCLINWPDGKIYFASSTKKSVSYFVQFQLAVSSQISRKRQLTIHEMWRE